jgi:hypothetical protein
MGPKKAKELYPLVAQYFNLDSKVVEYSLDFFWEYVRATLKSYNYHEIYLNKVGSFRVRFPKLDKYIRNLKFVEETAHMRSQYPGAPARFEKQKQKAIENREKLIILKQKMEKEFQEKMAKHKQRYEYISANHKESQSNT